MTAESKVGSPLGGSVSRTARLRELLGAATEAEVAGSFLSQVHAAELCRASREALPMLLDVAEAASEAAILEYDPARTELQNALIRSRAERLRDALAVLDNRKDKS